MTPISRGFGRRRRSTGGDAARVPPGQYLTDDFPVLSAGPTPHADLEEWGFAVSGEVDDARSWTWEEFQQLPQETVTVDIHCVTKWSKLDTTWTGVSVDTLLDGVETSAEYVTAWSQGGYTTNLPLEDLVAARRGWRSSTTMSRSSPSTAGRLGCSFRICTSGRAPSGCAAWS